MLAGLVVISFGLAASFGLRPAEALVPVGAVVFGLTALTAMSGSGPRAFL
jgi:hypothetical protein